MRNARGYLQIIATSAREDGANPQRLITSVVQLAARVVLIVVIYRAAYAINPHPGLAFANAMWSVSTYFAFILGLDLRSITRSIDAEIKQGAVEVGIVKPLDWRLVKICEHLGRRGGEFLIQLVLLPTILVLLVGIPNVSYLNPLLILGEFGLIVLAVIMAAMLFLLVGLSAFWLNDAMSLFRIVDKMCAVLCGSFVPFALLPGVVQQVVRWSPVGIYAAPQQLFNPQMASVMTPTLISGTLWTAAGLLLCWHVWRRVQRRIEVNGG